MNENWKPCSETHEISSHGNIRNIKSGRTLRLPPNGHGYARVCLYNKATKQRKIKFIHRLVAEAWLPPPSDPSKTQVNHIDGNKLNNHVSNLEWVTPRENVDHAIKTGLFNVTPITQKANKASVAVTGKPIKIMNNNTGVINFPSISAGARYLKISNTSLHRLLQAENKTANMVFKT